MLWRVEVPGGRYSHMGQEEMIALCCCGRPQLDWHTVRKDEPILTHLVRNAPSTPRHAERHKSKGAAIDEHKEEAQRIVIIEGVVHRILGEEEQRGQVREKEL